MLADKNYFVEACLPVERVRYQNPPNALELIGSPNTCATSAQAQQVCEQLHYCVGGLHGSHGKKQQFILNCVVLLSVQCSVV